MNRSVSLAQSAEDSVDYDLFMEGITQEERESACSGRGGRKELTGQDSQGENVETKGQAYINLLKMLCHTRGRWVDRSDELKEVHETEETKKLMGVLEGYLGVNLGMTCSF